MKMDYINVRKNYLEDLKNKNLEDKKAKKEAIKKNYDFFVGFSMTRLNKTDAKGKPFMDNRKILCTSVYGPYKCATLSTIDAEKKKIITRNYKKGIGYELDENDFVVKNFFWFDGYTSRNLVISKQDVNKNPLKLTSERKKYKTYRTAEGAMYVANDDNENGLLEIIKSKTINRIERLKHSADETQAEFFKNNDSTDSSFDENDYELKQHEKGEIGIKSKKYTVYHRSNKDDCFIHKDQDGNIYQEFNELCCFAKDGNTNKISVKRFFVYKDWLEEKLQYTPEQINNVVEIQLANFPTEKIRVINNDMSFEMMTTEDFIKRYVKDQQKKQEYLQQLEEIKKLKNSNISFSTNNNLTAKLQENQKE